MRKLFFIVSLCLLLLPTVIFAQTIENIVENINIPEKLRIRDNYVKKRHYGIIQNQKELKKIWSKLYDVYNDLNFFINTNDSPLPVVDFDKYSVVWYTNRGSGASFVESINIIEEDQKVRIKIGLFYSDFGSSHLNLWKVSKINEEVVFEETKHFETRGHNYR